MSNRKRIAGVALGVLVVGGATTVPVLAYEYDRCDKYTVCMYENTDFGGVEKEIGTEAGHKRNFVGDFNDKASSWVNRKKIDAEWFYDLNWQGDSGCMDATKFVKSVGWRDNDEASSARIYDSANACGD